MQKKIKYLISTLAVVLLMALFVIPQHESLQAATTLDVSSSVINAKGYRRAVQDALNTAAASASDANPYIVKVPAGTYTQDAYLYIGSNTTLDLTGCTIKRSKSTNMVRVGVAEDTDSNPYAGVTGYYYRNVAIVGGSFNGAGYNATIIKATHCQNFSLTNVSVYETKNGHLMEIGGVNGVTISGCSFSNQFIAADNPAKAYEAIQLDILSTEHMSGTRSEALATKNVSITNCTFSEVPRGVGSHTAVANVPLDTIEISNCSFENTKSCAIQSLNWINVSIHDNKINNTPRGIALYSTNDGGQGTYLPSVIAGEGNVPASVSDAYTPVANQNIQVYNNSIFLFDIKDPYSSFVKVGILASGCDITEVKKPKSTSDKSGYLPVGNYYISGVSIHDNKINTYGNGIRITDGVNCSVSNNTINCNKSTHADNADAGNGGKNTYGIQAREQSSGISIANNEINDANSNGIYISENSSCDSIADNTVSKPGKNGIDIEKSTCASISNNTVTSSKGAGVFVYDKANVTLIDKNTLTSPKTIGVHVTDKSKVGTISNNTVETSGNMGISISNTSTATTISTNTITKPGDVGIKLTSSAKSTTITKNTITSAKLNGIYVNFSSTAGTISSNTIKNAKKNGIDIENSTAKTITKNTISGANVNGIFIYDKGIVTNITSNTIKNAKKNGIDVENSTATTISKNKVSNAAVNGIFIFSKGSASDISNNTITDSGNQGISINTKASGGKITGNTVTGSKAFGIVVATKSKADEVSKNKCSKNKSGNFYVTSDSKVKKKNQK